MASKKSLEAAAATSGMFTEAKEQEKPKKENRNPPFRFLSGLTCFSAA